MITIPETKRRHDMPRPSQQYARIEHEENPVSLLRWHKYSHRQRNAHTPHRPALFHRILHQPPFLSPRENVLLIFSFFSRGRGDKLYRSMLATAAASSAVASRRRRDEKHESIPINRVDTLPAAGAYTSKTHREATRFFGAGIAATPQPICTSFLSKGV